MIYRNSSRILISNIRTFASKAKPKVELDKVSTNINEAAFKPRQHPGRIKCGTIIVPDKLLKAIENVSEDYSIKSLVNESRKFEWYLNCRKPPIEQSELKEIKKDISEKVLSAESKTRKEQSEEQFRQAAQAKMSQMLRYKVYNWTAVNYNTRNSLLYLFARFAPNYAALVRIFLEIATKDAGFKPRSMFDFGSGTGTATWAANYYWKKHLFEYFNVDASAEMNDLAQLLLQGGRGTNLNMLKGTFYRQFLPASNIAYDLVVCAFTLLELPSRQSRLQTILNLWNKTAHYLVVVEHGSNAGFKVVNEIRDFILSIDSDGAKGHIFSPCPHDKICPMFLVDKACNFEVLYSALPFSNNSSVIKKERFSYVVFKKGERSEADIQWPRVVEEPLVRSRHAICRMCTAKGKLQEVIFTASKHGKTTYQCARSTKLGDCLPVNIEDTEEEQQFDAS